MTRGLHTHKLAFAVGKTKRNGVTEITPFKKIVFTSL